MAPMEATLVQLTSSPNAKIKAKATKLLYFVPGYRWFSSFYRVFDDFYANVNWAICLCICQILNEKGKLSKPTTLLPKIKRFLIQLGDDEKRCRLSFAEYVNYQAPTLKSAKRLGNDYSTILQTLEACNIIDFDHQYHPEAKV